MNSSYGTYEVGATSGVKSGEPFKMVCPFGWENVVKPLREFALGVRARGESVWARIDREVLEADMWVLKQRYELGYLKKLPGWRWVENRWGVTEHYARKMCEIFRGAKRSERPGKGEIQRNTECHPCGDVRCRKFAPFEWASELTPKKKSKDLEGGPLFRLNDRIKAFSDKKILSFVKVSPGAWLAIRNTYEIEDGIAWSWSAVVEDLMFRIDWLTYRKRCPLPTASEMRSYYGLRFSFSNAVDAAVAMFKSTAQILQEITQECASKINQFCATLVEKFASKAEEMMNEESSRAIAIMKAAKARIANMRVADTEPEAAPVPRMVRTAQDLVQSGNAIHEAARLRQERVDRIKKKREKTPESPSIVKEEWSAAVEQQGMPPISWSNREQKQIKDLVNEFGVDVVISVSRWVITNWSHYQSAWGWTDPAPTPNTIGAHWSTFHMHMSANHKPRQKKKADEKLLNNDFYAGATGNHNERNQIKEREHLVFDPSKQTPEEKEEVERKIRERREKMMQRNARLRGA